MLTNLNRRRFLGATVAVAASCTLPASASKKTGQPTSLNHLAPLSCYWQRGTASVAQGNQRAALFCFESIWFVQRSALDNAKHLATGELRYIVDESFTTTVQHIRHPLSGHDIPVRHQAINNSHRCASARRQTMHTETTRELVFKISDSTVNLHYETELPEWLDANSSRTHVEMRSTGSAIQSAAELPASALARARRIHPWIMRNPQAWLDATLRRSTFQGI
jgi:hypothetical protein